MTKYTPVSQIIKHRLAERNIRYYANDNISGAIDSPYELDALVQEVAEAYQKVLDVLCIDTSLDHNSEDTAHRVAKMMVHEIYAGRYTKEPKITSFPNAEKMDSLYVVGPIEVRSACAHHHVPITGQAWVGVLPDADGKVIGLSKFHRIINWIASRPQIQEELTESIAAKIKEVTDCENIAVLVKAHHMCCSHRGVKDANSQMVTSVMHGSLRHVHALKTEFLEMVNLTK